MDIHKPKPIHGWRDFFKEVGIIVLGVSIALTAEQGVERWRQHQQYLEARQAMRDELANNLANISKHERFVSCTVQRMKDIAAILDRAQAGQPFQAPNWIGPVYSYRVRFNAEGEAGRSGLFTSAEQYSYGSTYSYYHSLDIEEDRERQAWGRLQMLEGQSRLSPEMIQSLRNALADARYENDRIAYLIPWAKMFSKQLELRDLANQPQYTRNIFHRHPHCIPMDAPFAEAERDSALIIDPILNDDRFKSVFEQRGQ